MSEPSSLVPRPAPDKPWTEPGLSGIERLIKLPAFASVGTQPASNAVLEAFAAVRRDALEEAARKLEGAGFLFEIGTPGEGPFTRQDRTMREVVEQGAAAIRTLAGN